MSSPIRAPLDRALDCYKTEQCLSPSNRRSIRKIAAQFEVNAATLASRVSKRTQPRTKAFSHHQALTEAEETCLVGHIRRAYAAGHPFSRKDIVYTANEIRNNRKLLDGSPSVFSPLGHTWFDKFKRRHPCISSASTRLLERSRFTATNPASLEPYFAELGALLNLNQYNPSLIFNMDETGYAIGASQTARVIIAQPERLDTIGQLRKNARIKATKVAADRQEWVTTVECISAAGTALPPLVIFGGVSEILSSWIPQDSGLVDGCGWAISHTGWTNSTLAYDWLTQVFQPSTAPLCNGQRRLLIVDGHGR